MGFASAAVDDAVEPVADLPEALQQAVNAAEVRELIGIGVGDDLAQASGRALDGGARARPSPSTARLPSRCNRSSVPPPSYLQQGQDPVALLG